MKKQSQSLFLLLAPCVALMAMAFYLSRRAEVVPSLNAITNKTTGPLRVKIAGIEAQKTRPVDVYERLDQRFYLVFEAEGARPKGWGIPVGWGNHGIANPKFWLERNGKRQTLAPAETQISTSRWDETKGRYFNEIRLRAGSVPDDAALKMSGIGQINPYGAPKFGPPIPFSVTLKKAGQKWRAPQVSRNTGITIRRVEITRQPGDRTEVVASLLLAPGTSTTMMRHEVDFADANWKQVNPGFGADEILKPRSSSRVYKFNRNWKTSALSKSKPRDLIFAVRMDFEGQWPLELAFPIKKDGQPIYGVVQPLTRPSNKAPLH